MTHKLFRSLLAAALLCLPLTVLAEVRLPHLVSSGMVLQRNAEVTIWGWAEPGEKITVEFKGATYRTNTSPEGEWQIMLPPIKAGGPYTMTISGNNTINLRDILVGDVWVASGQSNMELPMYRVEPMFEAEINAADYSRIRRFLVPDRYNFKAPQADVENGSWQTATQENIRDFSAVAYFFAKDLHQTYGVPIGIINAALGGSPVESWISESALKQFPEPYAELQRFKDDKLIQRIEQQDQERIGKWHAQLEKKDKGLHKGNYLWADADLDTSKWQTMQVPGFWPGTDKGPLNGVLWFRKTVNIPESGAGQPAELELGAIVDADSVFINGTFIDSTSYRYPPRRYQVPAGVLKAGANVITVRVISQQGPGGFVPDKPYELRVGDSTIDLQGKWRYQLGASMPPLGSQTFIRWKPTGLFNAMIAPLLNYRITGVIWYQGESNVGNAGEYRERFSTMIEDWRKRWGQGDFPFLFVQLANFLKPATEPGDSGWARLREAQLQTLSVPNTAMAVAIDVGEWNDIHPLDKQAVGERLAAAAKKLAYGEKIVWSGPVFESAEVKGNRMVLSFRHTGSGLVAEGDGPLREFAIAGADKQFVWAKAEIRGDKVVVWSEQVDKPQAVRYAWADNPDQANLYNREGLPASPFRTDNW